MGAGAGPRAGFRTHVTLHHIIEHVDFASAGVRQERLFRLGSDVATRILLMAHSVSVLLSGYQRTLIEKYSAHNVLLGTHGVFEPRPIPPDFSLRGNPDQRILAIGHWGTYKRLETLMEAFPRVLREVPEARLIVAGANHHTKPGYWEKIREEQRGNPRIEFRGYVAEQDIPDLYRTTSIVVMPYDSATGSSGPAHQACEYGVPIVCADVADFRRMAVDEDMAISFYKAGEPGDLADKLVAILQSPEQQRQLAHHNFSAAMRMTMPSVVRHYLRWFELSRHRQTMSGFVKFPLLQSGHRLRSAASIRQSSRPSWSWTLHPSGTDSDSSQTPVEGAPVSGEHDLADTPNSDLSGTE